MIQIEESNPSFKSCSDCIHSDDSEETCILRQCIHAVAQLKECYVPKQRKKGKWLFKERREPVYDISGVKTWGIAYMCPECGFIHTVIEDFGQYVYCPNCGAEILTEDKG